MGQLNAAALRAMVHHITRTYALEPDKLGSVRLHKILWYTEVQALRRLGQAVAGETFRKEQFGPFSVNLTNVVTDLKSAGLLTIRKATVEFETDQYIGKGQPDRTALTDDQWRILDQTMERIVEDHSAGSISEKSHGPIWEAVELHELMPVGAAALRWLKPTEADKEEMLERMNY